MKDMYMITIDDSRTGERRFLRSGKNNTIAIFTEVSSVKAMLTRNKHRNAQPVRITEFKYVKF